MRSNNTKVDLPAGPAASGVILHLLPFDPTVWELDQSADRWPPSFVRLDPVYTPRIFHILSSIPPSSYIFYNSAGSRMPLPITPGPEDDNSAIVLLYDPLKV